MVTKAARRVAPSGRLESLQQAAAELGVSVKTMRRRIADGTLHVYRVGRLMRVDVDELRGDMLVVIGSARWGEVHPGRSGGGRARVRGQGSASPVA